MDDMLKPYIDIMKRQQKRENYEEATYDQAHTFHTVVFGRHHLPPQAWTLDPLSTLPKEQYDDLWDLSLVAAGDKDKEMAIGTEILGALAERRNSRDYAVADIARKPTADFPQTLQELKTVCTERQELFKWRNISLNNAMAHVDTYYYGAKYATQHPIQLGTVVVKWANNPFNVETVSKVCSSVLKGEMDNFSEAIQQGKNNTSPKQPKIEPTAPILQNNPYFNNPLDPYQQQQKVNDILYPHQKTSAIKQPDASREATTQNIAQSQADEIWNGMTLPQLRKYAIKQGVDPDLTNGGDDDIDIASIGNALNNREILDIAYQRIENSTFGQEIKQLSIEVVQEEEQKQAQIALAQETQAREIEKMTIKARSIG
ncbi:hypothetical protein GKC56_05680 [Neisseriaceae bacterium PsAf]|nr:hypothetical protein [Neisseriaceae bacterium PsAf]